MDLDGTLTQHKSGLEPECRDALEALSRRYKLLMVCAGGCNRVFRQMADFPIDIAGWYGMQFSVSREGRFALTENHAVQIDRADVAARVETLRCALEFTVYTGESVEFHESGMITFPLLGTDASLPAKLAYDPDRAKRRRCHARVAAAFPEYTVFVGGTSSFDIVPKPFCKLYALERCLERYGLNREQAVYFGDDYGTAGNDEDVYRSGISFYRIDDYRDFPEAARALLTD